MGGGGPARAGGGGTSEKGLGEVGGTGGEGPSEVGGTGREGPGGGSSRGALCTGFTLVKVNAKNWIILSLGGLTKPSSLVHLYFRTFSPTFGSLRPPTPKELGHKPNKNV
jgi:hypothetical protein